MTEAENDLEHTVKLLVLLLQQLPPGRMVYVELDSPMGRATLPDRLRHAGLVRPSAYVHCNDLPEEPPLGAALGAFLEETTPHPEVLFVDGLESRVPTIYQPGDWLDRLNFDREALAGLPVVLVFLVPRILIQTIRARALNLWTWNAGHFALDGEHSSDDPASVRDPPITPTPPITPKTRERRIQVLRRLFRDHQDGKYPVEEVLSSVALPLIRELGAAGRLVQALTTWNELAVLAESRPSFDRQMQDVGAAIFESSKSAGRDVEDELRNNCRTATAARDFVNVCLSLEWLARLYISQHRYADAASTLSDVIKLQDQLFPNLPVRVASRTNIGVAYALGGDFVRAEFVLRQAWALGRANDKHSDQVANTAWALANVLTERGKYAEAQRFYETAIGLLQQVLGRRHERVRAARSEYRNLIARLTFASSQAAASGRDPSRGTHSG